MNPELEQLKAQVAELIAWKEERERQQFKFPIDVVSMKALNEAFMNTVFTRINVGDIYFQAQNTKPTQRGQMHYFDDRITQEFQVRTSTNPPDIADFTGSINLTAI